MKNLKLWDNDLGIKKITLINPGDFDVTQSVKGMGFIPSSLWNSLGICSPEEIWERNYVMGLLFHNPKLRKNLNTVYEARRDLCIPTNEDRFLAFYEAKENPYWLAVKQVIAELRSMKVAGRLADFCKEMESSLSLEAQEKPMALAVAEKLKNVAVMEGTFDVTVDFLSDGKPIFERLDTDYIHGYKIFNSSYSSEYNVKIPEWIKIGFLRNWIQKIANKLNSKAARKAGVVRGFSHNLVEDLKDGFKSSILPKFFPKKSVTKSKVYFNLYFNYSSQGLTIRPIAVTQAATGGFSWKLNQIPDLSPNQKKFLSKKQDKLRASLNESTVRAQSAVIYSCFPEGFFGRNFRVSSQKTDSDFRWFAIGHVYRHRQFKDVFGELDDNRKYFFGLLSQINFFGEILSSFERKAQELKLPLCIPEISFKEHSGVSFSKLAPIGLIKKTKDLVPITLERINGQVVGLTGRHGGGKTVAGKTVLESVYLALSGLPVFAEKFSTDIKSVLGAVTNDEGDGSTATVFVEKVANLMRGIKQVSSHESLVFVDEIGKGTQQDSGMELGKMILQKLSKGGNSVLFNTQILELAQYVEQNLNGVCYKVDKDHNFVKGIAGGDIMDLAKEKGLLRLLKN